jgi:hypothetical protein
MHTKRKNAPRTLLIGVTLSLTAVGFSTLARQSATARAAPVTDQSAHLASHPPEHRTPTIDGAVTADRIPDDTAYRLFLRMAAHPDPVASRTYLEFIFNDSVGRSRWRQLNRRTLERLVSAVNEHALWLSQSEDAANSSGAATDLQSTQGEALDSFRRTMAVELGPGGDERLRDAVERRVKTRIRVFSKP